MLRSGFALLCCLLAPPVVFAGEPPKPVPPPTAPPPPEPPKPQAQTTTPKIETVKSELLTLLQRNTPNATINTRHEAGPERLTVVTAAIEKAYPGSGVARVLIDEAGVTYGVHGEQDFADLARARKWLTNGVLPSAEAMRRLVDVAFFEGVAMWMDKPAPTVERGQNLLKITLYRTWHPSGGTTKVTVTVGAIGKATVESITLN